MRRELVTVVASYWTVECCDGAGPMSQGTSHVKVVGLSLDYVLSHQNTTARCHPL